MDQTQEILNNHIIYGASDSTNQNATSIGKLNYANGGSIQHAWKQDIVNLKTTLHWKDTIGLAGAENQFLKLQLKLSDFPNPSCFEELGWQCVDPNRDKQEKEPQWDGAFDNDYLDLEPAGQYEPAQWIMPKFPVYKEPAFVSVRVENIGTKNHHNDNWLDTRLYTKERFEHPYDLMYVKKDEYFYIGFHARNTKRTAYDIKLHIGEYWVPYSGIKDKRFVRRLTKYGNYSG